MKLNKILVGLISFLLLSSFLSISVTADQLHTVRGFITVDGQEPSESHTVKLVFGDTIYENQSLVNGWYEFSFQGHDGWTADRGYFYVNIDDQEYSPIDNESIWLFNASQIYYQMNLSIDTGANNPPEAPTLISPSDNSTVGSSSQATLSVDVYDEGGDVLDVTFYRGSGSILDTVQVNSGESASFVWSGLSASTTYSWYAVADDGLSSTQSPTWSFTTKSSGGSGGGGGGGTSGGGGGGVFNIPPVADAGGPYVGFTPDMMIDFDGSNSTDSDGTIENYTWDFGEGNVSYEMSPSFAFEFEGTYSVVLEVTDNLGSKDTDTVEVEIVAANNPPTDVTITGPGFGSVNESLAYIMFAMDVDGDALIFDVDWGDGDSNQSGSVASGNDSSMSHVWSVAGVYTIEVTASDNETSSSTSKVVAIDAIILYHNGSEIGYVTDDDGDGVFDTFHGNDSSALGMMDAMYLVDVDADGTFDVSFNESAQPPEVEVQDYEAEQPAEEADYTWLYVIIILLILVLLLLYLRRESNEGDKSDDSKPAKDAPKAAAAKKSSDSKKGSSKKSSGPKKK